MGPQRKDWTFPKSGSVLIEALELKAKKLAEAIDEKLDEQELRERELAEYRETLRKAGVEGWNVAVPSKPGFGSRDPFSDIRSYYNKLASELVEVNMYIRALEDDVLRDPHRKFKLLADDLVWFGL